MDIRLFLLVFKDQIDGFLDMPDTSLTKNIKLFVPYRFGFIHIPLHYGHAFGRQIQCGIIGDRFFRDEHTACMNGSLVGHILHHVLNSQYFIKGRVLAVLAEPSWVGKTIYFLPRQPHYFTDLTDD